MSVRLTGPEPPMPSDSPRRQRTISVVPNLPMSQPLPVLDQPIQLARQHPLLKQPCGHAAS